MTTTALDAAPFLGSGVWAQVVPLLSASVTWLLGCLLLLQAGPEEPISKGMGVVDGVCLIAVIQCRLESLC